MCGNPVKKCPIIEIIEMLRSSSVKLTKILENVEPRVSDLLADENNKNPDLLAKEDMDNLAELIQQLLLLGLSTEKLENFDDEENNLKRRYISQLGSQLAEVSADLIQISNQEQATFTSVNLDEKVMGLVEVIDSYSKSCE